MIYFLAIDLWKELPIHFKELVSRYLVLKAVNQALYVWMSNIKDIPMVMVVLCYFSRYWA